MDRRLARTKIMARLGQLSEEGAALEMIAGELDRAGDPIPAGELRRFAERLSDLLDQMYVWAGNI